MEAESTRGGSSSGIDLDEAMLHPSGVFNSPAQVIAHQGITLENKRQILTNWADQESQKNVATSEGMPAGDQPSRFREVEVALLSLDK